MIVKIDYEIIYHIWANYLWKNRISPIEPVSAMLCDGTYDMQNFNYTPTFFGYYIDNKLVGVNSGHMCCDDSYRSRGLYVFESCRKQGIGQKLLLATIDQGNLENAKYVWSYPKQESFNTYQRVGFNLVSDWRLDESGFNGFCKLTLA